MTSPTTEGSEVERVVMRNWIPVTDKPHPLGVDFVAYYGNGSKRKAVVWFEEKGPGDLAISHWLPLPELPTLAEEYEAMMRVLDA